MRFIGVDLAWQGDKNHTGAAVLSGGVHGGSLVAVSDGLTSIDARLETLERLKNNYEERAYLQLKALVNPGKP